MPEYIEREALLNEAKKRAKAFSSALIYEAIKEAPAADVVEVVRCKDCVFCRYNENADVHKCDRRGYFVEQVTPNDYCSKGERSGSE